MTPKSERSFACTLALLAITAFPGFGYTTATLTPVQAKRSSRRGACPNFRSRRWLWRPGTTFDPVVGYGGRKKQGEIDIVASSWGCSACGKRGAFRATLFAGSA